MDGYRISPKCAWAILGAAFGSVGGMTLLTFGLLPLLGFGAAGPVAGSLAAWAQSLIGAEVAAGSIFSILQSIGMAGIGINAGVMVTGASATVACALCQALGLN